LESTLLFSLLTETDESVAARHATDGVRHDFGRFARLELVLEQGEEDVFVDIWSEVANEDRELWSAVITIAVSQSTTGSPVELERTGGVWNQLPVELQGFRSSLRCSEINKAISSVTAGR
jgi:hypothetical protein